MEKLGLGPKECLAIRPGLVYGRMNGWGQDGILANAAGHDVNYIALTGALDAIGGEGGPPIPDRKRVVAGKRVSDRVEHGGRRKMKKKETKKTTERKKDKK